MEYRHVPNLLAETLQHLCPRKGSTIVDCTLGAAGHTGAILNSIGPGGILIGIDQDIDAVKVAAKKLARFSQQINLVHDNFAHINQILKRLKVSSVDGFLFDLGLSSAQVEGAQKGFSYRWEGPLDMRLNRMQRLTAQEVVNNYSRKDLALVIKRYGEERWAERIAHFIVKERERKPITSTSELVAVIKKAIPAAARRRGGHPAKRTFQALRIEVNRELEVLKKGLRDSVNWLKPGGRIVVISYHSLEDRIVKTMFKELATACVCPPSLPQCECGRKPLLKILTKKLVRPSQEEVKRNPRAKSARLRAAEKVA